MLDQLGLADALAQECFACKTSGNYDKHGNEVSGRGWSFMENMKDSVWDFALILRQKYQEDIFRRVLAERGVELEAPVELVGIRVDKGVKTGGYRITAKLQHGQTGAIEEVKCRYLIGADGGRSYVRRAMSIPFDGSSSEDRWVRVDGVVETNVPKSRSYCAIESPTHGNVLWAPLDHGATRIGYAFTAERQKAYETFDEAAAVKEAIAACKPFNVSFTQIDWWTIYVVGQRVARNFFVQECVFLAGDACHTHSSGAAQGMNTGLHDAVNLSWKLSLVLRGLAKPDLLLTYESDRKPNVQKLINYDKDISRLMTMRLPVGWTGDPNIDPNDVLAEVMAEAATFSSGLGIYYEMDGVLSVPGSWQPPDRPDAVGPGKRVPDAALQKPGTFEATRMHKVTPNVAKFYIVVFAGDIESTRDTYHGLIKAAAASRFLSSAALPVSWITVSVKTNPSAIELLGITPPGKVFYDRSRTAHDRYGVDVREGAVFVFRPDGWIGTVSVLAESAIRELESYFGRFSVQSSRGPIAKSLL